MDDTPALFLGSCLCGAVRYEVRAQIKAVSHCHCTLCQKAHGAAFGSYGSVPRDRWELTHGSALVRSHHASPQVRRSFCGACGSPLTWQRTAGEFSDWICFSLGTLDTPFTPLKQRHVHGDRAAPWHCALHPPDNARSTPVRQLPDRPLDQCSENASHCNF